ncbi:hypothetical protein PR202_ga25277 [Eleusine coracana subsp. coracana]|uniref:Uncharacterized protein n=1 Tax=Eleusine coracana subsp. coracana TaxID=191504 RepID=A0AAV5DAZ9_ELECO|nr:hypothetical protein PR202_ga25277 [Eleusine coracana subsp. coracana]
MESAAGGDSSDPPLAPPTDPSPAEPSSSSSAAAVPPGPAAPPGAREVAAAMEAVERDATAIADSYAALFASLRDALSNVCALQLADGFILFAAMRRKQTKVTSTSAENMECLGDVVGRLQESALEASSKGNKYINSCLR